jgi:hypothetical protein
MDAEGEDKGEREIKAGTRDSTDSGKKGRLIERRLK